MPEPAGSRPLCAPALPRDGIEQDGEVFRELVGCYLFPKGQHHTGAGRPASPVWQNCGFYDEPVRDENAVHALEHGAVWITFQPDLSQEELERLSDLTRSNSYVLVSPYAAQDAPLVATAWGAQQRLGSAEDAELEGFIEVYGQDPNSAPSGAHSTCTGGIGSRNKR